MWFWHRKQVAKISAPVMGEPVNSSTSHRNQVLVTIHPTDLAVYAPVNGEIVKISHNQIQIQGLDHQTYLIKLNSILGRLDWQVRVGDSVSPLNLLGTISDEISVADTIICERLVESHVTSRPRALGIEYN